MDVAEIGIVSHVVVVIVVVEGRRGGDNEDRGGGSRDTKGMARGDERVLQEATAATDGNVGATDTAGGFLVGETHGEGGGMGDGNGNGSGSGNGDGCIE